LRTPPQRPLDPRRRLSLFPVLNNMLDGAGRPLGRQQQQLAIGRALVMRPRLLLLDEPTEGIQPSIIKDIGRAIAYLRNLVRSPSSWSSIPGFARGARRSFRVMTAARSSIRARPPWTKPRSSAQWRS